MLWIWYKAEPNFIHKYESMKIFHLTKVYNFQIRKKNSINDSFNYYFSFDFCQPFLCMKIITCVYDVLYMHINILQHEHKSEYL